MVEGSKLEVIFCVRPFDGISRHIFLASFHFKNDTSDFWDLSVHVAEAQLIIITELTMRGWRGVQILEHGTGNQELS